MTTSIVDDFARAGDWLAVASGEATLQLTSERAASGHALRMDFDFKGGGGFVVARKEISMLLPETYAFAFRIRGAAPKNKLEFKLIDASGKNVWRWQEERFDFRRKPRELLLKNRAINFAWGPAGGGALRKLGAVEFVISAGPGRKGTVWLEEFRFINRTPDEPPLVSASSSAEKREPQCVLDAKSITSWSPARRDTKPWLQIDFHQPREYGGLVIEWPPKPSTRAFTVEASDDGKSWRVLHRARSAEGSRTFIRLPDGESRFLRLAFAGRTSVRRLEVQPFDFSRSLVDFVHAVAGRSPRGHYPRWLIREQSYWTCAGIPDGRTCALINEEGLVEPDKGTFSLEPFLFFDERLHTWNDARRSVRMEKDGIAIPTARWRLPKLDLDTTAFATGHETDAILFVRYRVRNTSKHSIKSRLLIAIRPYQVNPPWQSWQGLGGVSQIDSLAWKQNAVCVNGDRWIIPMTDAAAFGAAAFEQGSIADYLADGRVPALTAVRDESGLAAGAMHFNLSLSAGASRDIFVAVPFGKNRSLGAARRLRIAKGDGATLFAAALTTMRQRLAQVSFRMPAGVASEAAHAFRTAAGQILINRDGPALQPGPRRYTRSWIRDGVIMGAALLRAGEKQALPDFIRWYAPHQRRDGFVPCCVDRNGPDWLVEHDSHGQLIYGVMESFRFTGDHHFLQEFWPHVRRAARFLGKLRGERLTAEYQRPETRNRLGLLPESASHEGYLAQPVHSYWDDFWALRGFKDAAAMARELGHEKEARDFAALEHSLGDSLRSSLAMVIADKQLSYVPGSVEWSDFDPTATANAVSLLQSRPNLPAAHFEETFTHYVRDFRRKRSGEMPWTNYSAYEIRIIGALVRLGKRAEALELLTFFLSDRRPRAWNQWPEISWKNPRSPGHLGDVPHTWIAAEYMLAFAQLFAYEREEDDALVVGAGVDARWLKDRGFAIRGLPTWHGKLDLTMRRAQDGSLLADIGGELRAPRGGFVVQPPDPCVIRAVSVNGAMTSSFTKHEAVIHDFPTHVLISFDHSNG